MPICGSTETKTGKPCQRVVKKGERCPFHGKESHKGKKGLPKRVKLTETEQVHKKYGVSALQHLDMAGSNYLQSVEELLRMGINPMARHGMFLSPFEMAMLGKKFDLLMLYIRYGANINLSPELVFTVVIENRDVQMLTFLLEVGGLDPNLIFPHTNISLLSHASSRSEDMARILLEHGAIDRGLPTDIRKKFAVGPPSLQQLAARKVPETIDVTRVPHIMRRMLPQYMSGTPIERRRMMKRGK